ncbi:MAG TPA: ISNCY family transposase [Chloroflexota bacterium]|nr:ISNCY family transposase [Chloroflexota bacterium]
MTLNGDEQKRLLVLNEVIGGRLTARKAGELLKLSERQLRRILADYRKEGAAALVHGNRGRKPVNVVEESVREQVLELARTKYVGFNHLHMSEMLRNEDKLPVGRSTVRRILLEAGIASPKKRRPAKHRSRRARYPKEGMLLQIDGSPHDWLEGRGPMMSLIGGIDDATGTVPFAQFRPAEDSAGYFLLLKGIVVRKGVPMAVYHDRHSIFEPSSREPMSLAEQLSGHRDPTQFGRLLEELGIASISARSPQAKGRIERLWETFQDRLVSEMRLKGISSLEEANRFLKEFLPRYNQRFAVAAAEEGSAYRLLPEDLDLEYVFSFRHRRTVGADNTVRFGPKRLQLLPSAERASYVRAEVEVCVRLDGTLAVYHQRQRLQIKAAPLEAAALRVGVGVAAREVRASTGGSNSPARKAPTKSTWGKHFKLAGSRPNLPCEYRSGS